MCTTKRSKRRGGSKLSTDPQSVAARERRHRISAKFKILQGLVPGGSKMDTVSMLDEAVNYVKFLKKQIWFHQSILITNIANTQLPPPPSSLPALFGFPTSSGLDITNYSLPPLPSTVYSGSFLPEDYYNDGYIPSSYK